MDFKTIITNVENLRIKKDKGMDAQQLYDCIIKPTHKYMGGNYESENANFLSLCTAAIESNCGYYRKQINGPALGPWQMEPETRKDIYRECDALMDVDDAKSEVYLLITSLKIRANIASVPPMVTSPFYACAMARLKYSMDIAPLPDHNNLRAVYDYYKRIYNTPAGASTWSKFKQAIINNKILEVKL